MKHTRVGKKGTRHIGDEQPLVPIIEDVIVLAYAFDEETARKFSHAVNVHEELVEALERITEAFQDVMAAHAVEYSKMDWLPHLRAKQALAKAKGETS